MKIHFSSKTPLLYPNVQDLLTLSSLCLLLIKFMLVLRKENGGRFAPFHSGVIGHRWEWDRLGNSIPLFPKEQTPNEPSAYQCLYSYRSLCILPGVSDVYLRWCPTYHGPAPSLRLPNLFDLSYLLCPFRILHLSATNTQIHRSNSLKGSLKAPTRPKL